VLVSDQDDGLAAVVQAARDEVQLRESGFEVG